MAKIRVSYEYSEAEDKSIRLGLFLIVCGIVSLFILGFCWLNPALQSMRSTAANCTVVSVRCVDELFECVFTCGADCRGTSLYPCLQVFVNNSESNSVALLHYDEQQLVLNPKVKWSPIRLQDPSVLRHLFLVGDEWDGSWTWRHCEGPPFRVHALLLVRPGDWTFIQSSCSYVPPCERDNQKNKEKVLLWQDYWTEEISSQSFTCFFNQQRRPDDVLWKRSHDENVLLHCVLWPLVSLLLGTLIVLLTICARSLAVRAEAIQKRKFS